MILRVAPVALLAIAAATKTAELRRCAADHNLSVIGEPALAFYNPPWTSPFFRRNEIILELAAA
jgi:hypothetical protein